jgi:Flp pilus assembly protein TadD
MNAWRVLILLFPGAMLAAQPTFTKDIAPIVFSYCSPCHRPGESAPFSLLGYGDVKKHAGQIVTVTKSRFMPPWLPEPGFGNFDGVRRLSDRQIALIGQWVARGAPEGDPSDLPRPPKFSEGWQLGKPDLILEMPRAYTLRPGGTDVYRNFIFPVPVEGPRYVRAVEVRPGNPKIVHHANILIDRDRTSRALDGADGEPGFPGMELKITSEAFDPDGYFLFWKPGTTPFVEPEGMAWRVDRGTDLVLNMHLQPSGKAEEVRPALGLYFTDTPPAQHPMLVQLENDKALDIPAGAESFPVKDDFTLPADVAVLAVYPHAHYLGKELQGFATLPNGVKQWLIWIKHWDLNWQAVYRYSKPVFLPKGTVVSMRYTYDNSANNPANPNRPPQRVRAGNRASDEMAHLWLQVLPRNETGDAGRVLLQEALMRAKLRKDPADFSGNYNLGAALGSQGKFEEAIRFFGEALKAAPADATVHNSLGAALEAAGKLDEAARHFEEALKIRPDYPDAHYNLANALLAQGKFEDAAGHLRAVVRANPGDAAARGKLVAALQEHGKALAAEARLAEAIAVFREAVELAPEDADLLTNTGTVYARAGELKEAEAMFLRALRVDPGHAQARRYLELVRKQLGR